MSVAKSCWKWGSKMAKMLKNGNGNWFSLENQIFQGFTLCPWQKVGENGVRKWQNCKKTEAELDFLRKIKFFKASPQYSGKKLRNFATGNGNRVQKCLKTLVFEKNPRCFSKNFEKLPVFSKKITGNGNRMLKNLEFWPKIKFFKVSRALWQKVGENGVRKWQKC